MKKKERGMGNETGRERSQQASLTVLTGIKISKNHFKKYYYPPSHHVNINVMKLLINVTTRSILKTHTNIQFTVIMFFSQKKAGKVQVRIIMLQRSIKLTTTKLNTKR